MSQFSGNNPYYANSGSGGGGGYLAGGSPFGSASGSPGGGFGERSDASHSLRPVTIGQICKATQAHTDAEWRVDDAEIGQITVVAQVISIQRQATNSVYWLDDGSGRVEARHWVDSSSEEDNGKWGGISENVYVRATGSLRSFGNKRYINVTHIRLAKDPHELYFHIMEAMTVNLIFERGPPSAVQNTASAAGQHVSAYTAHSTAQNDGSVPLSPMQRSIVDFIRIHQNEDGVHCAAIARSIGGNPQSISQAVEALMDSGHIYSAGDDSHFKVSS